MTFIIYLIGIVDDVKNVFTILGYSALGVVILAGGMMMGPAAECNTDNHLFKLGKKIIKRYAPLFLILGFLGTITPDSKTIAAMYLIPKVAETKQLRAIPGKALKLFNLKLDQWIEDVQPKGSKNKDETI